MLGHDLTKRQRIAAWLKRERERAIVAAVTKRIAPQPTLDDLCNGNAYEFARRLRTELDAKRLSPAQAFDLVSKFSIRNSRACFERDHA